MSHFTPTALGSDLPLRRFSAKGDYEARQTVPRGKAVEIFGSIHRILYYDKNSISLKDLDLLQETTIKWGDYVHFPSQQFHYIGDTCA